MNAFYEHHKDSIEFRYRCFDRLLLNGLIQPFQQPERVLGFFNAYRDGRRVTHRTLSEIADQYVYWLRNRSEKWGAPIVDAPEEERRDDFVLPYLKGAEPDRVAVILRTGTGPHSGGNRRQGQRQPSSGVQTTLGEPV